MFNLKVLSRERCLPILGTVERGDQIGPGDDFHVGQRFSRQVFEFAFQTLRPLFFLVFIFFQHFCGLADDLGGDHLVGDLFNRLNDIDLRVGFIGRGLDFLGRSCWLTTTFFPATAATAAAAGALSLGRFFGGTRLFVSGDRLFRFIRAASFIQIGYRVRSRVEIGSCAGISSSRSSIFGFASTRGVSSTLRGVSSTLRGATSTFRGASSTRGLLFCAANHRALAPKLANPSSNRCLGWQVRSCCPVREE